MIKDSYNRIHNYLRISLTDNCNLRCFYCMPEEKYEFASASQLMQKDEIEKLARIFVNLGVNKIRLTGGEPLVRKDAGDIIRLLSVKVNIVVMKGLNDNEINDFVEWTKQEPVHVRFIEFMPFTGNWWTSNKVFTMKQMLQAIAEKYDVERLQDEKHDTAKAYRVPGHKGTFAFVSTMSANFCSDCNRIRLTADGKMKNCLFAEKETDLLSPLRRGEDVVPLIHQNIHSKAKQLGGQFTADFEHLHPEDIHNRSMITIGG